MQTQRHSMKWKVIRILLVCWLIPLTFLLGVMGIYVGTNHSGMTALNYQSQMDFNARICVERLNRAVALSRKASYDGAILQTSSRFREGQLSYNLVQKEILDYLNSTYLIEEEISGAILWFGAGEEVHSVSIYSERNNGNYQQIRNYWDKDHETVSAYARTLDTSIGFLKRDNTLYLIRNMKDSHYDTQAVLVLCLNQAYCFNSITQYPMQDETAIWINETNCILSDESRQEIWESRCNDMEETDYQWIRGQLCVVNSQKGNDYHLRLAMMIQKSVSMFPFYGYEYVVGGMFVSLLIMLWLILRVFRKEVTRPVEALYDGVQKIEQGKLGYHIEEPIPNKEFNYLSEAINHMSDQIHQQFNRIYEEEIALREARIMALQSHINPHFLNNTMEIINWEARLEGNEKVSRMISALSHMMDAAMDRGKRPQVLLREEMSYVNSYLYIMKERLGKKLTVEINVPEDLLDCQVPRLILQPVIENAIEHGVVPNGSGTVTIQGDHDETNLYLTILNDGGLSAEDRDRIRRLLDPDYNTAKEPAGNLGIANVNQRLRILFGPPCGLEISEEEAGKVTARLTIPWSRIYTV